MPYSAVTQPLPVPLRKGGGVFLQAGGDEDMGVAEFDEAGAFGMLGDAGFEADAAQFIGGALAGAHGVIP